MSSESNLALFVNAKEQWDLLDSEVLHDIATLIPHVIVLEFRQFIIFDRCPPLLRILINTKGNKSNFALPLLLVLDEQFVSLNHVLS